MSDLHLVKCVCHGYEFWGRVHEGLQSIDNFQAGTSIIDLERIYGFENQQTPAEFSNLSYPLTVSGAQVVMPIPPQISAHGSQLPLQCGCGLCGGLDVPQRPYQPIQSSPDPGHWNGETLSFSKGGCGIRVLDAAENRLSGLVGGDDFMFVDTAVSTFSLRIEWPGYRMWTGKFRAKNWGGSGGPVTRARLVSQLGKRIAEFIEAMDGVECTDFVWKVGSQNVQPLLRLLR